MCFSQTWPVSQGTASVSRFSRAGGLGKFGASLAEFGASPVEFGKISFYLVLAWWNLVLVCAIRPEFGASRPTARLTRLNARLTRLTRLIRANAAHVALSADLAGHTTGMGLAQTCQQMH